MSWVADMMTLTLNVYRVTRTADSTGGFVKSESLSHTVKGYISKRNVMAKERAKAGKLEVEVTHDFFCMPDQDVRRKDVLEFAGRRYLVVAISPVYDATDGTAHHMEGELSEIQEAV
jgi:SPP1 family predicted phage head-tail adaptor